MNTALLSKALRKTIKGYHLVNETPIKEAVWENILCTSLKRTNYKYSWNCGGHESGKDITVKHDASYGIMEDIQLSCKSCKETRTHLNISSYRMTKCNTITDIITEIDEVRANFSHYAVISRLETDVDIEYSVYYIPSNKVKATSLEWTEKYDKKKSQISGWQTNESNGVKMSVTKSMSNQLWIALSKKEFSQYQILTGLKVSKENVVDYFSLYDMLSSDTDTDAGDEVDASSEESN